MQPTRQMRLYKRRIYLRSICPIHVHPLYDVQPRVLIGFAARVWYFSLLPSLVSPPPFFTRVPLFHSSGREGWRERGDLGYWPVYPAWRRPVPPWRSMDEFDSARLISIRRIGRKRMIKFERNSWNFLRTIREILTRFVFRFWIYCNFIILLKWFTPEER